tara:strand:- start:177 stop:515 length:339 start_codon:yes stop_codon:yes gene_type:complete
MVQVEFEVHSDIQGDIDDEEVGRAAWEGYIEAEVTQLIGEHVMEFPSDLEARIDRIEDALDAFIKVLRPAILLPQAVPKPRGDKADDDMDAAYRARVAAITATEGTKEKANV